jgi:hypothetical protein
MRPGKHERRVFRTSHTSRRVETTNAPASDKRAISPTAGGLQIIFLFRCTMIPGRLPSNHRLCASFSRRLSAGRDHQGQRAPHNSFCWKILQGTSLFSRFYGAALPVSFRKQGICSQNRGGGMPYPTAGGRVSHPFHSFCEKGGRHKPQLVRTNFFACPERSRGVPKARVALTGAIRSFSAVKDRILYEYKLASLTSHNVHSEHDKQQCRSGCPRR